MMTLRSPSEFGVAECPAAGEGCHRWLMSAVNALIRNEIEEDEILDLITEWMSRPPQPNEIENTIRRATQGAAPSGEYIPKFLPDPTGVKRLTAKGPTSFEEIKALSPIDPDWVSTTGALRALYGANEKTIIFTNERSQGQLVWSHATPQEYLDNMLQHNQNGAWFLMNPVTGLYQKNERLGKASRRSEENTTSFKYLLVESDNIEINLWLTILKQLPLRISCITLSGNSSAHALIQVGATNKEEWTRTARDIAAMVVPLGACPGSLTAVRLTRLPKVTRKDNRKEQSLIYLNPKPSLLPLELLPKRTA